MNKEIDVSVFLGFWVGGEWGEVGVGGFGSRWEGGGGGVGTC